MTSTPSGKTPAVSPSALLDPHTSADVNARRARGLEAALMRLGVPRNEAPEVLDRRQRAERLAGSLVALRDAVQRGVLA